MKKVFLLTALLSLPLSSLAFEPYEVKTPEWKDFCPSTFVDVQEPKRMKKLNIVASYWYQRRLDFEAGIAECKEYGDNELIFSCYEKLKVKQYKENTDYNARVEAKQRAVGAGIPEMRDRTDTMLPINNYINNYTKFMPNEVRGF